MSKKLPTKRDVRILVAEDIRQEIFGKISVQGLMPGEEFLVGGAPPQGMPPNVAFVLPSLAFVFVITGGEGKFPGRFKVIAPDKKTVVFDVPTDQPVEIIAGKPAMLGTAAKPFIGPAFGKYTVLLELEKAKFAFAMNATKAPSGKPRSK